MFNVIENAVANTSRTSAYAALLNDLPTAVKNADGMLEGKAVDLDKPGQVFSLRAAAKVAGVSLVTRKQTNGIIRCWKINARKPRAKKASKKA
jgi:hypothetical protein